MNTISLSSPVCASLIHTFFTFTKSTPPSRYTHYTTEDNHHEVPSRHPRRRRRLLIGFRSIGCSFANKVRFVWILSIFLCVGVQRFGSVTYVLVAEKNSVNTELVLKQYSSRNNNFEEVGMK